MKTTKTKSRYLWMLFLPLLVFCTAVPPIPQMAKAQMQAESEWTFTTFKHHSPAFHFKYHERFKDKSGVPKRPTQVLNLVGPRRVPIVLIDVMDLPVDQPLEMADEIIKAEYASMTLNNLPFERVKVIKNEMTTTKDGTPAAYVELKARYRSYSIVGIALLADKDNKRVMVNIIGMVQGNLFELMKTMADSLEFTS